LLTPYDFDSVMQYASNNDCDHSNTNAVCFSGGACINPPLLRKGAACSSPPVQTDPCWISTPDQLSIHDINAMYRAYEKGLGQNTDDDQLGSAFAVGDFDGDGYMDLAVGAPGNNAVFLWKGTGGAKAGTLGRLVSWKVLRGSDVEGSTPFSKARFGASLA